MPRFLLALTVTLTALTFALSLTARAWGETQPPHPALRGFVEGCEGVPQPCWFGIVPGKTSIGEAVVLLGEKPFIHTSLTPIRLLPIRLTPAEQDTGCILTLSVRYPDEDVPTDDRTVAGIAFEDCVGISFGGIGALRGVPNNLVEDCWNMGQTVIYRDGIDVYLYPPTHGIAPMFFQAVKAFTVTELSYTIWSNAGDQIDELTFGWHGLAKSFRYEQLQPEIPECNYFEG
jgi:hypothetical protein